MRIQNAVPEGISAFMGQTTAALIIGFMQKMSTGRLFYVAGTSLLPATIATTVCHHRGIALDVLPTVVAKPGQRSRRMVENSPHCFNHSARGLLLKVLPPCSAYNAASYTCTHAGAVIDGEMEDDHDTEEVFLIWQRDILPKLCA